jgi:hypothetical protein
MLPFELRKESFAEGAWPEGSVMEPRRTSLLTESIEGRVRAARGGESRSMAEECWGEGGAAEVRTGEKEAYGRGQRTVRRGAWVGQNAGVRGAAASLHGMRSIGGRPCGAG